MSGRKLTLDHVWIIAALALIGLRPLIATIPPHDFWWHMATGRMIVTQGRIPQTDSFSYTRAGEPFYNQGWLAQVGLYRIHQIGGIELLVLVQALVMVLAYGLLLWLCIQRSGALRLSVALLLVGAMPVSFSNWLVRPQSYAIPLFVAFLLILTWWRLGDSWPATRMRAPLWLLPPLMVLWVNLHGSFVLGGGLIALTFIGEGGRRIVARWRHAEVSGPPLRHLLLWGGVTAAALLINPRGFAVLVYVQNLLSSSQVTRLVEEWAPPTIRDTGGQLFFGFLLVFALILIYARKRPDPVDLLITGVFLWLALGAVRNVLWVVIVMLPLMTIQAATRVPLPRGKSFAGNATINMAITLVLVILVVLGLPWIKPHLDLPPDIGGLLDPNTPVAAVEVLRNDPQRPTHLFHAMGYGSYLIWAAPEQKVFVDPRIELYPFSQWQEYIVLGSGHDVDLIVAKYAIDGLLLDVKEQQDLLTLMRTKPGWAVRYEDERTVYMVRN